MPQKTFRPEVQWVQQQRRWHALDAREATLGRLATRVASLLKGKHKPFFTPSIDCGDFVVVTHAAQLRLTGKKAEQRHYFRHSGYAGGAKTIPLKRQLEQDPRKVVYLAVKRMLDPNRFRSRQLARLRIYKAETHPHAAQFSEAPPTHAQA